MQKSSIGPRPKLILTWKSTLYRWNAIQGAINFKKGPECLNKGYERHTRYSYSIFFNSIIYFVSNFLIVGWVVSTNARLFAMFVIKGGSSLTIPKNCFDKTNKVKYIKDSIFRKGHFTRNLYIASDKKKRENDPYNSQQGLELPFLMDSSDWRHQGQRRPSNPHNNTSDEYYVAHFENPRYMNSVFEEFV